MFFANIKVKELTCTLWVGLDLAVRRVAGYSRPVAGLGVTLDIGFMSGTYWLLFLLFALIVMVTSQGVFVFLRQKQEIWAGNMDNSAWFLIILLILAILSIGSFIAFVFLRGIAG
jgi:hypothetical protein